MILIIDNYDSFTYNLVQRIGELGYRDIRVLPTLAASAIRTPPATGAHSGPRTL